MNKYFKEIENVNEGKFLSLPVEVVPSFMFFSFRFIINSIILIMELKHLINEELYTNSLLISPNPDQQSIIEFYWVKKNSIFSTIKEKRVINATHQLYYQCTIFDYLSTIELIIMDQKGIKNIYVFGPIQLQPDLYPYLKIRQLNYSIKAIFNKKQTISTITKIQSTQKALKLNFQLSNGIDFSLDYSHYNEEDDYEGLFKIQQIQSNQIDLNFARQKKVMVQIFKKLKIYSYQGNFLKLHLKNQMQKDIFLLNLLMEVGFIFEPQLKKKKSRTLTAKVSEMKTQSSHNKQISGSLESGQINITSHHQKDNGFHDVCDALSSPKNQVKELVEKVETPISKIDHKEGFMQHNISDSIELQFFDTKNKNRNESPFLVQTPIYRKQISDYKTIDKDEEFIEYSRRKSQMIQKDFSDILLNEQKKMKEFFREKKKLQEDNRYLIEQNKELKARMHQIRTKKIQEKGKQKQIPIINRQVPLFIKEIHIEKSIKKINEQLKDNELAKSKEKSQSKSKEKAIYSRRISNYTNTRYSSNTPIKNAISKQKDPEKGGFSTHQQPTSSLLSIKSFSFLPNQGNGMIYNRNPEKEKKKLIKINYGKPKNGIN